MQTAKYGLFGSVLTGAFLVSSLVAAQTSPSVVATVQPVHSLVSAVMEGVATPELLLEGGGSPHSYSLRPSHAQALEQADAIVWVGEGLETFLQRPLESLGAEARVVTLSELSGAQLLETRSGGTWNTHDHHAHGESTGHDHGEDPAHGSLDMHIWLDPDNARAILTGVRDALSDLDPGNRERYEANTREALEELDSLEADLQAQLAKVADRPYIVFHDAYHYFEEAFGLNAVGSVTLNPQRQPGVRRMAELREKVEQLEAVCVFSEPQFEPRLVSSMVQGTSVRTGELDPLGADLEPGPQAYFELMQNLGNNITDCLSGHG